MDILRILPDDVYNAAVDANAPSASNVFATMADLIPDTDTNIYNTNGTVGAGRIATLTDSLTFSGGTTIHTLTNASGTVQSGTGINTIGFGAQGALQYLGSPAAGDWDYFEGGYLFGADPVYAMEIYDKTTFVEKAGQYAYVQDFAGTVRPYTGLFYTADGISYTGIEANNFGTRVLDQNPLNKLSALSAADGIAFLSGVGGQGYIGTANQTGFATWIGTTLDPDTIFTGDGDLTANRIVSGGTNRYTMTFNELTSFQVALKDAGASGDDTTLDFTSTGLAITDSNTPAEGSKFEFVFNPSNPEMQVTTHRGGASQQLSKLVFADAGGPRIWSLQDASGTIAHLTDIPAATGDGIYDGSGTTPTTTVVTLTDTLAFDTNTLYIDSAGAGYVGVNNTAAVGAEIFGVTGFARVSSTIGVNGANPSTQGAINVPLNSNLLAFNGVNVMKQDATDGVIIQSANVNKINFDILAGKRVVEMDGTAANVNTLRVFGYEATVGDPECQADFELISNYWDGGATAAKTANIFHEITAAPAGTSQLAISIAGTNLLLVKDGGQIEAPDLTIAEIDAGVAKGLVTKEWVEAQSDANGIYGGSGSLVANTTVSGAFDLIFANTGDFKRTGDIIFTEGGIRELKVEQSTGLAGYDLTISAGAAADGLGTGGDLYLRPGAGGTTPGGSAGDIQILGAAAFGGGSGSDIIISSGASNGNQSGGDIDIVTGASGGVGPFTGGNFTITTGTGPAARGAIILADGSEGTIGDVWTSNAVTGEGEWVTPARVATGQTYTVTNEVATRSFDADSTTLNELADVVGTLIEDLKTTAILN